MNVALAGFILLLFFGSLLKLYTGIFSLIKFFLCFFHFFPQYSCQLISYQFFVVDCIGQVPNNYIRYSLKHVLLENRHVVFLLFWFRFIFRSFLLRYTELAIQIQFLHTRCFYPQAISLRWTGICLTCNRRRHSHRA